MAWFVMSGNAQQGPFDAAKLLADAQSGALVGATPVRRDGDVEWRPLDEVRAALTADVNPAHDPFSAPAPRLNLTPNKPGGAAMNRDMKVGISFLVLGVVITGASYLFAEGNGGRYVFTWGLIFFGLFRIVRGFMATGE